MAHDKAIPHSAEPSPASGAKPNSTSIHSGKRIVSARNAAHVSPKTSSTQILIGNRHCVDVPGWVRLRRRLSASGRGRLIFRSSTFMPTPFLHLGIRCNRPRKKYAGNHTPSFGSYCDSISGFWLQSNYFQCPERGHSGSPTTVVDLFGNHFPLVQDQSGADRPATINWLL